MPPPGPLAGRLIETYRQNGFLLQDKVFQPHAMDGLCAEADIEFGEYSPRRTSDRASGVPYRMHGSHLHSEVFADLVRAPALLPVARQLLGDDVYVHQFKIVDKRAFHGPAWGWHQDFTFWHKEDGIPAPRMVTAVLFLDDVTDISGPMVLLPGGHAFGTLDVPAKGVGWAQTLTADLKYPLDGAGPLRTLMERIRPVPAVGERGSVLWLDCNTPHGSAPNMSCQDRRLVFVTYNSVTNAPAQGVSRRPDWLAAKTCVALHDLDPTVNQDRAG